MQHKKLTLALALASSFAFGSANATTVTSTINVSANIAAVCTVASTAMSFGAYDPTSSSPNVSTSTITANCTNSLPYNIDLTRGTNSASFTPRTMKSGTNTLNYNLFTDPARTTIWGDGVTGSTVKVSGTGNGTAQTLTVYGQIPALQSAAVAGAYTDNVTVNLVY